MTKKLLTKKLRGQKLACIRGDKPLFSNLDFELSPGRALILRGANGSGKSSLMKIIAGLLRAQSGALLADGPDVLGQDVLNDKDWISRHICYLAHKNGMKPEMTVGENLTFWARLEHHDGDIREQAQKLGIDHCLDLPVSYLSSGQARRAALTRILCHPANIWLLDEPTVGLDHNGVELLSGLMDDHLTNGGMIIAATHIELGLDPDKSDLLNLTDFAYQASYKVEDNLLC